jgi:hypothetical protein
MYVPGMWGIYIEISVMNWGEEVKKMLGTPKSGELCIRQYYEILRRATSNERSRSASTTTTS